MPRVSVIVATYNRPGRLNRCLEAMLAQTYRDFEVVVVDDGSEPGAQETLDPAIAAAPFVRVVRTPSNRGPAAARNLGVAEARGEFIAFIDDDIVADASLLQSHLARAEASTAPLAQFGPLAAPPDWRPTPWNLWEAHTLEVEYRRMLRGSYAPTWKQFFTGNAFLRKSDFLAVGGFDEHFTRAEDIELGYRLHKLGATFTFVSEAIGWHYSERSRQSWLAIARDYGRFEISIDQRHPDLRWLHHVQHQQAGRNRYTRIVGSALRSVSLESAGIQLAVRLAQVSHRFAFRRLTIPILSFAYALEYNRSLDDAMRNMRHDHDTHHGKPRESAEPG